VDITAGSDDGGFRATFLTIIPFVLVLMSKPKEDRSKFP